MVPITLANAGPVEEWKRTDRPFVSLLTRLYEPDEGEIRANGTPIRAFPVDAWRSAVAVVRQDPFVFNDTLRYNVTVGNRDVSADRFHRICEIARVTEFVDDLPAGYDTVLGDEGVKLSGGQRQRVSIARALLRTPTCSSWTRRRATSTPPSRSASTAPSS